MSSSLTASSRVVGYSNTKGEEELGFEYASTPYALPALTAVHHVLCRLLTPLLVPCPAVAMKPGAPHPKLFDTASKLRFALCSTKAHNCLDLSPELASYTLAA